LEPPNLGHPMQNLLKNRLGLLLLHASPSKLAPGHHQDDGHFESVDHPLTADGNRLEVRTSVPDQIRAENLDRDRVRQIPFVELEDQRDVKGIIPQFSQISHIFSILALNLSAC